MKMCRNDWKNNCGVHHSPTQSIVESCSFCPHASIILPLLLRLFAGASKSQINKKGEKQQEEEETEREKKNSSLFLQQRLLCLQAFICHIKAESGLFTVGLKVELFVNLQRNAM